MGWQSYYLAYKTLTELKSYLKIINQHNQDWNDGKYNTAEGLVNVTFCKIIRQNKTKGLTKPNCLLFGTTGGGRHIREYFKQHGIELQLFEDGGILKYLDEQSPIEQHPNKSIKTLYRNPNL